MLNVRLNCKDGEPSHIHLNVIIADSTRPVGLRVTANPNRHGHSGIFLLGDRSNTFTGKVEISGENSNLVLHKTNNAIAVRGNILIQEKAILRIRGSNQLLKSSNITLRSGGAIITESDSNLSNILKNLTIKDDGIINFAHKNNEFHDENSKYYLYADELIIHDGGNLTIKDWQDGRDFLLVRKTSQHLTDALKKMEFKGYNPADIHLRDYNSDYWQISALPEPTTYGAIISTVGLVLAAWQRRRKRPPHG